MVLTVLSSIDPPHGFHRTIRTSITLRDQDRDAEWIHLVEAKEEKETPCSLHLYYELPLLVFVDPYELVNYQHLYTFQHYGNANLELPVAAMGSNGTSLILKLNPKLVSLGPHSHVDVKDITVPIHLRYGEISDSTSRSETHRSAEIAWPEVFLSCDSEADTMSLTSYSLPEELMSSSFSSFGFEGRALLRPIQSSRPQTFSATANQSNRTTLVSAPVGHSADLTQVRLGTSLTIMVMFCYLAYVSYSTARRLGKRSKVE
ncbi:PIG-X [Lentinula raphanica]|nr:PIG-X [Lentinula raphanica]